ncbi:MAG: dihydroorotate dehydrogenase (quinone) [Bacteroidetes bacterium HGW-Bacteroidetes-15]|nr:MAG: dihydroorotate dehydrogenase (quinone) [Bacteroidetes bacterium HGW-Bacteroidetes-15]
MYNYFIRPVLFLFQPETVHHIVVGLIKVLFKIPFVSNLFRKAYSINHPSLKREVFGLQFPNPVGLAAGFDKNAEFFNEFSSFGFSFVEIGTVTPKAQPGNLKPRSFRLKADKALINRMGFNNLGVGNAVLKLKKRNSNLIVGGNIGKNTATPNQDAHYDYLHCFTQLYDHVDYFVVNVSCPNITNLKELQDTDNLKEILSELVNYRLKKEIYKPILLKISPDLNNKQLDDNIDLALELNIDGFVATNTTTSRKGLTTPDHAIKSIGNGGLSGKPLRDRSTEIIRYISTKTKGKVPIIGVGGIITAEDAIEKLDAGASLVQIYTGFIYSGPGLVKRICKAIIKKTKGL